MLTVGENFRKVTFQRTEKPGRILALKLKGAKRSGKEHHIRICLSLDRGFRFIHIFLSRLIPFKVSNILFHSEAIPFGILF